MKIKLFLSALMLMVGTLTATYASFPVQRTTSNNTNTTVVVENQEDELSSPAIAGDGKSQIIALVLVALVGGICFIWIRNPQILFRIHLARCCSITYSRWLWCLGIN